MAQEHADTLHAAIAFEAFEDPPGTPRTRVVAATGIDLASVRRWPGNNPALPGALLYAFDLVEAISDAALVILQGMGPMPGNPPISNDNARRAIGDTTQRRFWVWLRENLDHNLWIEFHRIPTIEALDVPDA